MVELRFTSKPDGEQLTVQVSRLLVAGFTGRDRAAVDEHIEELASVGVPVPEKVPSLYQLEPHLLTQATTIAVEGSNTSGEVEPVLIRTQGQWLLTVGSDHTDRDIEREEIHASKAACPKVVGGACVDLARVQRWDDTQVTSSIDGGVLYQDGRLAQLLPFEELLGHLADDHGVTPAEGDVLFLGTVPAIGGIRPSSTFEAALQVADSDEPLTVSYSVTDSGRPGNEESL